MDDEERINEEEAAEMLSQYRAWLRSFDDDMPTHKQSGWAERVREAADLRRKELRESIQ